jgi:integrase
MPLTDPGVRAAKATEKPYKLTDGGGLHLLVTPTGGKLWRFRFTRGGREKLLSLGKYPDLSIAGARDMRDDARRMVANGGDPAAAKQERKQAARGAKANSFKAVALEWLATQRKKLAPISYEKKLSWLDDYLFPYLGTKLISEIEPRDVLPVLLRIERRKHNETAHRVRSLVGNVMRYAIAHGKAKRDAAADLRGALAPVVTTNRAALTYPSDIGELMRRIDAYRGQPATEAALKLAPLLFVRPGELRAAEWSEFDLAGKAPLWRIPARRMKIKREHIVPLSRQAVAILRDLEPITGEGRLVFPSIRADDRPISENTINLCLRAMGYTGKEMTGHGFRAMASTLLNELGNPPEVIELQLAHKDRDEVRAAYNRSSKLAERSRLMQAWADHLDKLKASR